ncbi:MAG: argininosuccinate lyase [Prevotellamassilia sp.]
MKLWEKNVQVTDEIDRFTVGHDRELDRYLAKYDVLGSMAHVTMLHHIGLIADEELPVLLAEPNRFTNGSNRRFRHREIYRGRTPQVELMLTRRLGDVGKKIHSGRSRNDQVLLDLKLFARDKLREVAEALRSLFEELQKQSERYQQVLMPGYTHLQVAMPSSFGLWFGAYAESLADDLLLLEAAYRLTNRNPLGSAAGYGSSFPLDRQLTTDLLGFDSMNYNVVYAQMGRGKMERTVAFALAGIAGTVAKLAYDACLFNSQNFGFVKLPDECTTGSSIMPHKKNPDVFELIRARMNRLQALPQEVVLIMNNLPCGYFRDLQELKEVFIPAFDQLIDCLHMTTYIIEKMKVNEHLLDDTRYDLMFSVEEVNRLAAEGMPFRDAYKKVGLDIEAGKFRPVKEIHHTHAGSIGNLCNQEVAERMLQTWQRFGFDRVAKAEQKLLQSTR